MLLREMLQLLLLHLQLLLLRMMLLRMLLLLLRMMILLQLVVQLLTHHGHPGILVAQTAGLATRLRETGNRLGIGIAQRVRGTLLLILGGLTQAEPSGHAGHETRGFGWGN